MGSTTNLLLHAGEGATQAAHASLLGSFSETASRVSERLGNVNRQSPGGGATGGWAGTTINLLSHCATRVGDYANPRHPRLANFMTGFFESWRIVWSQSLPWGKLKSLA